MFVSIDKKKKQKRKYTSLFIKYLQAVILKATPPGKVNPLQIEAITKRRPSIVTSLFLFFNYLGINAIIVGFFDLHR